MPVRDFTPCRARISRPIRPRSYRMPEQTDVSPRTLPTTPWGVKRWHGKMKTRYSSNPATLVNPVYACTPQVTLSTRVSGNTGSRLRIVLVEAVTSRPHISARLEEFLNRPPRRCGGLRAAAGHRDSRCRIGKAHRLAERAPFGEGRALR